MGSWICTPAAREAVPVMYGLNFLEQLRADQRFYFSLLPADVLLLLGTHVAAIRAFAAHKFNTESPDNALIWLREQKLMDDQLESVARFLLLVPELDKAQLGSYLTFRKNKDLLRCYLNQLDFAGLSIPAAMRLLLSRLRLVGDGQGIDRLFEAASQRYLACNPTTPAKDADGCYVLWFGVIMLATNLYSPTMRVHIDKENFARQLVSSYLYPRPFLDAIYDEYERTTTSIRRLIIAQSR